MFDHRFSMVVVLDDDDDDVLKLMFDKATYCVRNIRRWPYMPLRACIASQSFDICRNDAHKRSSSTLCEVPYINPSNRGASAESYQYRDSTLDNRVSRSSLSLQEETFLQSASKQLSSQSFAKFRSHQSDPWPIFHDYISL